MFDLCEAHGSRNFNEKHVLISLTREKRKSESKEDCVDQEK